jgi:hypothetical protein
MKPEVALRHIKTLIDGSDYLTNPRAMQTLIESIRVLVEKGLPSPEDDAFNKLRTALDHADADRKHFAGVDALLSSVEVTLAANKVGNETPITLGRLKDNLNSDSYRRLCAVIQKALEFRQ